MKPPSRRTPRKRAPSHVVGIGASSEGLEALKDLLRRLPKRSGMAFVVACRGDGADETDLVRALSDAAPLPVALINDGSAPAADTLHVVPPGREATLADGRFAVRAGSERGRDHAVDFLFVSLARERGERAIGVVLSGAGRDGAQGLAAIRAQKGVTLAQDPATARPPDMPAAAVSAGAADFVLAPKLIAEELAAMSQAERPAAKGAFRRPGDEELIQEIVAAVRKAAGLDFSHYKRTTLARRVQRRMTVRRIADPAKYADYLRKSPAEARALGDEVLIHVTSFFREPEAFAALKTAVFEPLVRGRSPKTPLRVWVPGCSTGEEVYSLAIALCEFLEEKGASFPLQIFGTDVSEKVVAAARQGKYAAPEVPPALRRKYFVTAEDGQYQVSKSLRELCVFAAHDLTRDPPYSNLDLISCRNVLIYFDQALQEHVIPLFHYALSPSGFLMLGPSESIDSFKDLFAPVGRARHVFAKKTAATRLPADMLAAGRAFAAPAPEKGAELRTPWSLADLTREADRIVLTTSAPGVVISESLDVLQFRGDVSPFLAPAPGKASFNLGKMAREGLLFPVTRALDRAKKTRLPVVLEGVEVKQGRARTKTQVQVIPIPGVPSHGAYFLVLFADPSAAPPKDAETLEDPEPETRERRLERELQATRRAMEAVIEKQQVTNEDLQSANEELRSRNEEYQSSLEELQTAHEELQSANEELATLNDELRKRTEELDEKNSALGRANDELVAAGKERGWLAAIVDSSDDAVVSKDLRSVVTSWNRGAERLFGYAAAEAVGRPITELVIPEDRLDEEPRIIEKIRRGERITHFETVRRRKDGTLVDISLTLSPIYDPQGALVGVSKIARDITERKQADLRLERVVAERTVELRAANEELEAFCYAVAHDLRAPLRSIGSFAQLLQRRLDGHADAQVGKDFQRILENASRMSELIDSLLHLSRLTRQELRPQAVDLSALAEGIGEELRRAEPARAVRFTVQPRLTVRGDARLLDSLLHNLLENSWKFTAKHATARVEFGAREIDGETAYFVRDDGAGFDPAFAGKLFSAFQRLHRLDEFAGIGIGLATAKRIVTRHGGRMWAEGKVGKGATFYFTLAGAGA